MALVCRSEESAGNADITLMRRASLKEVVDIRRERNAAPLVRFERNLKSDNNGNPKRCMGVESSERQMPLILKYC